MARLTDPLATRRPTPRQVGGIVPLRRIGPSGAEGVGLQSLGEGIERGGERLFQAAKIEEDRVNTIRAESALNKLNDVTIDLARGDNGFTKLKGADAVTKPILTDYSKRFDDAVRQISTEFTNDAQNEKFIPRADVLRLRFKEAILRHVGTEGDVHAKEVFEATLATEQQNAALMWNSPNDIKMSLARVENAVEERAEREGFSDETTAAEKLKEASNIHKSVVRAMLNQSPLDAKNYLDTNQDQMDPDAVFALRNAYITQADRFERLQDKKRIQGQDLKEEQLLLKIIEGGFPSDTGELKDALRSRQIRREQFERLDKALKGDSSIIDDPQVEMDLDQAAADGDPTVRDKIDQALIDRTIKGDTAAEIFRRSLQSAEEGGIFARADIQQARRDIEGLIGGLKGPLAVIDSVTSERVIRARRIFDNNVRAAVASGQPINAERMADSVVAGMRSSPRSPTTFPRPKFLVGSRGNPDLERTRDATLEAFKRDDLTERETAEELRNLDLLKEAVEAQQARLPPKKKETP